MFLTRRSLLQSAFAAPAFAPSRPLEEVVVVFKTHFDIGYTDLARNVVAWYRTAMIDNALEVVDRSREMPADQRFVWTVSGWPMTQILYPAQDAARRRRILEACRRGQFATHALPFSTHTESLDPEDLVRGLGFSARLARSLSLPLPRDAKMTDVPCHSWIMPVLLRNAGIDFLHIGCNAASSSPEVPLLCWWEGPDGSRLLTFYSAAGYGSGLEPPAGWPHPVWLALIHTGDNEGPPKPEAIEKLLAEARQKLPGVKIRFGRLSDFADAVLKSNPELPVVRGDMADTWIHGIQAMPAETAIARSTRPRIMALEALHTLLGIWQGPSLPAPDIAAAREQSLLYGEHTWGMDAKRFPRLYGDAFQKARATGQYRKAEESYAEHGGYARHASALTTPALDQHLSALASSVQVQGDRIVVFNPLAWSRDALVEMPQPVPSPEALKDTVTGEVMPVRFDKGTLRFRAANLPPLGYRTYIPITQSVPEPDVRSQQALENEFLRVTFSPEQGGVTSVIDKRSDREWVMPGQVLGQYLYERFSNADVDRFMAAYVKSRASWAFGDFGKPGLPADAVFQATYAKPLESSSDACSATLGSQSFAITFRLHTGCPWLDISWSITAKKADPWPEAGWLCFPLNIPNPGFRLARPGAVIDPAKDLVRGSNHEVFCLNSGLAVLSNDGSGVGLCPIDSPLVSLGHPGPWRYSKEFGSREARVYVNLFNNQWSTNFAQWVEGSWTSRVRLWSIAQFDVTRDLIAPAWEVRYPAMSAASSTPAGKLPPTQPGITLSRPGIAVTAFGPNPDGPGIILRLWEQAGVSGPCTVTLPAGLRPPTIRLCDLRGQLINGTVPVADGQFTVAVGSCKPVTVLLESA